MIAQSVARSVARSVGRAVTGAAAASVPATQRVQNGDFASATGWNTSGAAWTIAAGVATNNTNGMFLTNTLVTPTVGGETFNFAFDVVLNPAATGIVVSLFNSSTLASQSIFTDGSTVGTKNSSGTVSGAFDQLRIAAVDDPGAVIDNVSLLA